jgi:replication factor C large subunit
MLTEKYKPNSFKEILGQDFAILKIQEFIKNFPKKKALILHGSAGTGKTTLVYVLAKETDSEILEINASDLRNREQIKKILGNASQQVSLFEKNKIFLIDEVDGINKEDRGGLLELISLIETSSFPVFITANDIWNRKFNSLRKKAELVEVKNLNYQDILTILKKISEKESLGFKEDLLKSIAIKSNGDVRAAINDIQTLTKETTIKDIEELSEREKGKSIFEVLSKIFQNLPDNETLWLYDKTNLSLDEIFLWIEENIPNAYENKNQMYKSFEILSRADIFKKRIMRQQYWRFLVYENALLSYGIGSVKKTNTTKFIRLQKPSRILKIWIMNQKQKHKKSISEKYANYCHISIKKAMKDFPIIKQIIAKDINIQKDLQLEQEEIDFIE